MTLVNKIQRLSVHKMQRMQFLCSNLSLLFVWPLAGLLLVGTLWGVTFSKLKSEKLALHEHAAQDASLLAMAHAKQAARSLEKLDECWRRRQIAPARSIWDCYCERV